MDNYRKSEYLNPRYANPSCNARRCNTRPMPPYNLQPKCNQCNKCDECTAHSSSHCADPLSELPLAMAYVPWQHWNEIYELDKGLSVGTIFPELNKPFLGSRCC